MSMILGGWRIAGVHSYASGYPADGLPGLRPAADRRRQPHHGARLQRLARADAGRQLRSARRPVVGPERVPARRWTRSISSRATRAACCEPSSATRRRATRTSAGPGSSARTSRWRARSASPDAPGVPARGVQPVRSQDLGSARFDDHERELRPDHWARQPAAAGPARRAVRVLIVAAVPSGPAAGPPLERAGNPVVTTRCYCGAGRPPALAASARTPPNPLRSPARRTAKRAPDDDPHRVRPQRLSREKPVRDRGSRQRRPGARERSYGEPVGRQR